MSVENENRRNQYTSTGGTGYDFDFLIYDEEDILVTVTDATTGAETTLSLTTGYTVSDVGEADGGRVSTVAAVDAGDLVTITRNQALTQKNTLSNTGDLDMDTITQMFDEACMRDQMLKEELDRTVKVTVGSSASAGQWLDLAAGYKASALAAATAAAASEANALGYETGAETAFSNASAAAADAESAAASVSNITSSIAAVSGVAEAASALANSNSGRMYWAGVRQTVEYGQVDSSGYADFLKSSGGSAIKASASSAYPLQITFAGGWDSRGPLDSVLRVEDSVSLDLSGTTSSTTYIVLGKPNAGALQLEFLDEALWSNAVDVSSASPSSGACEFNIPRMQFRRYTSATSTWDAESAVPLGEFEAGSADTIAAGSVVSYAIRGRYDSDWFTVAADTTYSKSHNLGLTPKVVDCRMKCINAADDAYTVGDEIYLSLSHWMDSTGNAPSVAVYNQGNATKLVLGPNFYTIDPSDHNLEVQTISHYNAKITAERGW